MVFIGIRTMIEWILIIHMFASPDHYSYVRFKHKASCEQEATLINNEGTCIDKACKIKEITREASCIEDGEK